jgi:hypothetical protein
MAFSTAKIGLLAAGFALGTLGVKAAKSKPAKQLYVHAIAKGMQAKSAGEDLIEQARVEIDDVLAEASYINEQEAGDAAASASTAKSAKPAKKQK